MAHNYLRNIFLDLQSNNWKVISIYTTFNLKKNRRENIQEHYQLEVNPQYKVKVESKHKKEHSCRKLNKADG